jgi:hypothetical protein
MKVSVSKHAIERAVDRFRINPVAAAQWIKDNVERASFIANIIGSDGRACRLYAFQRAAFILADTSDYVLTVYSQHSVEPTLKEKVRAIISRELAKAERQERTATHKANVARARLEVEIAECNYRMYVTPSKTVIAANVKQLERISDQMAVIDVKLTEIKRKKAEIARSIVAYV